MMVVDLRSDTVTLPTKAMYEAIANAPLGDDVLGDEPTVGELEKRAAETMGKEAAMFVPSGTMGNLCAVCAWTKPGDAVIIEEEAHILYYESGGAAVIAGAMFRSVPSDGVMDPYEVEKRVTQASIHTPGTTLLCLENSHNRKGGAVVPVATHKEYKALAVRHGLNIHLDGARVFNAATALGVPVREIVDQVDSVNFCLSKGLAAPAGSVLCGSGDFITRARQWRKRVGGGMRQAGVLAACGLISLTEMPKRLDEDHKRAAKLHDALAGLHGLKPTPAITNILMINTVKPAQDWSDALGNQGVKCFAVAPNRLRLVTHNDVTDEGIDYTIQAFKKIAIEFA